ncbi:MAG: hypothetical protein MI975_18960 [Cytophagales bacterium]|nr:hypothetical protein [Cytophagales bacterium]
MLDRQLHKFYISYRLDGEVRLEWVEGINLRHAKERIEMRHAEASDLMDWTNEKEEDLQKYLTKVESEKRLKSELGNFKDE